MIGEVKTRYPDYFILVGNLDLRDYVVALTKAHSKFPELIICSRGHNTSKAIDLSLMGKSCLGMDIVDVELGTVQLPARDGSRLMNISEIKITVRNNGHYRNSGQGK